jgi:hypothetical protein
LDCQPTDGEGAFLHGADANLWYTRWPWLPNPAPPQQVDGSINQFQAVDTQTVFVCGIDSKLWYTPAPFGKVPNPDRAQVAENVGGASFGGSSGES